MSSQHQETFLRGERNSKKYHQDIQMLAFRVVGEASQASIDTSLVVASVHKLCPCGVHGQSWRIPLDPSKQIAAKSVLKSANYVSSHTRALSSF